MGQTWAKIIRGKVWPFSNLGLMKPAPGQEARSEFKHCCMAKVIVATLSPRALNERWLPLERQGLGLGKSFTAFADILVSIC